MRKKEKCSKCGKFFEHNGSFHAGIVPPYNPYCDGCWRKMGTKRSPIPKHITNDRRAEIRASDYEGTSWDESW